MIPPPPESTEVVARVEVNGYGYEVQRYGPGRYVLNRLIPDGVSSAGGSQVALEMAGKLATLAEPER